MEDDKEDPKGSSILEEEHSDMHEVSLQPMHITTTEKDEFDEENILDEIEMFFSSIDINKFSPSLENHGLEKHQVDIHTILVAPKEVVHEKNEDRVKIIY